MNSLQLPSLLLYDAHHHLQIPPWLFTLLIYYEIRVLLGDDACFMTVRTASLMTQADFVNKCRCCRCCCCSRELTPSAAPWNVPQTSVATTWTLFGRQTSHSSRSSPVSTMSSSSTRGPAPPISTPSRSPGQRARRTLDISQSRSRSRQRG